MNEISIEEIRNAVIKLRKERGGDISTIGIKDVADVLNCSERTVRSRIVKEGGWSVFRKTVLAEEKVIKGKSLEGLIKNVEKEGYSREDIDFRTFARGEDGGSVLIGNPHPLTKKVPYQRYNAPKRVCKAVRGLKDFMPFKDSNFLEATVKLAEDNYELKMTEEDGIIVSKDFAKRAVYVHVTRQNVFGTLTVKKGDFVVKGQLLIKPYKASSPAEEKFIQANMLAKNTGRVIKISDISFPPNPAKKKIPRQEVVIEMERSLGIGDKLMGLTGLKSIIVDVRDQEADIVLHPNMVNTRPAMQKELEEKGTITVFIRKGQLLVNRGVGPKDLVVSHTLYSILAMSPYPWEKEMNTGPLKDILFMNRVRMVERGENVVFELIPPEEWNWKERGATPLYMNKRERRPSMVVLPECQEWFYNKKGKQAVIEETFREIKGTKGFQYMVERMKNEIAKRAKCTIPGYEGVLISHSGPDNEVWGNLRQVDNEGNLIELRSGTRVTVRREPAVDMFEVSEGRRSSVLGLVYRKKDYLPEGVLALSPAAARMCNGDNDGDTIHLVVVNDPYFHVPEKITPPKTIIPKKPLVEKTEEEWNKDLMAYINKTFENIKTTQAVGGASKTVILGGTLPEIKESLYYSWVLEYSITEKGREGKITLAEAKKELFNLAKDINARVKKETGRKENPLLLFREKGWTILNVPLFKKNSIWYKYYREVTEQ